MKVRISGFSRKSRDIRELNWDLYKITVGKVANLAIKHFIFSAFTGFFGVHVQTFVAAIVSIPVQFELFVFHYFATNFTLFLHSRAVLVRTIVFRVGFHRMLDLAVRNSQQQSRRLCLQLLLEPFSMIE